MSPVATMKGETEFQEVVEKQGRFGRKRKRHVLLPSGESSDLDGCQRMTRPFQAEK